MNAHGDAVHAADSPPVSSWFQGAGGEEVTWSHSLVSSFRDGETEESSEGGVVRLSEQSVAALV